MQKYPRSIGSKSFDCPHCNAYAEQTWANNINCSFNNATAYTLSNIYMTKCRACGNYTIWSSTESKMLYPSIVGEVMPIPRQME